MHQPCGLEAVAQSRPERGRDLRRSIQRANSAAANRLRCSRLNTLCVNPLPQKESVLGVVHSCGGCEGPQSRTPTEALLGGLTGDPECHSQLTPGVPETSGCNHGAGELLLGCCELSHRRLDGLQGAPVASMDEAAADHALAQGGAPGIAAGTQRHRPVGDHGAVFAVGTKHRVIGVAASGLCVNVA